MKKQWVLERLFWLLKKGLEREQKCKLGDQWVEWYSYPGERWWRRGGAEVKNSVRILNILGAKVVKNPWWIGFGGEGSKRRKRGTKGNFPQNLNCMCSWPMETSGENQGWSFVKGREAFWERREWKRDHWRHWGVKKCRVMEIKGESVMEKEVIDIIKGHMGSNTRSVHHLWQSDPWSPQTGDLILYKPRKGPNYPIDIYIFLIIDVLNYSRPV